MFVRTWEFKSPLAHQRTIDQMKIAFHTNQICLQGTEVALFDYAHFNEKLLGNESIIISRDNPIREKGGAGKNQPLALQKFKERFPLFLYKDKSELESILKNQNVDMLYAIKKGTKDGIESPNVRTAIHTVFKYYEPHGDAYAYVSQWLSELMTQGKAPYVPHMIHLPKVSGDLRKELGIPENATVFGRYGGTNSFDIDFVHTAIRKYAQENPGTYFLFMNTDDFLNPKKSIAEKIKSLLSPVKLPNVIFLPASSSLDYKSQFINTCDVMLHARFRGETFGIAVGEFSVHNKPVLTYGGNQNTDFESNHIDILGDKAWVYNNIDELLKLFEKVKKQKHEIQSENWDAYSAEYGPEVVMKKFNQVFIQN